MRPARHLVLVSLLTLWGSARAGELERLEQELAALGRRTRTLSAGFTQKKKLKLFRTEVTTRGRLYYEAPDRLRWETEPPDASTLLVVGNRAELRLPGERPRVLDLRRDQAMATLVEQLLFWLGARPARRLSEWYRVELSRPGDRHGLTLHPRLAEIKKRVTRVVVSLSKRLELEQIELSHPGGDRSLISFAETRRNKPLPREIFK